jgi:chromosome partitioning protein
MKKISIISQKGGAGKTTLCLHLAVAAEREGHPVALLDLDPQASAASWTDIRGQDTPSVTPIPAMRLNQALALAERSGAALAIIDTAPHSADAAVAVAEAADLILIPCRPGILDIKAIETTARIVRLTRKPAFVVLTQVPPRAPRLTEDAVAAVQGHRLDVAPIVIHQRSAYAHALTVGQTAQEFEPNGKAAEETARLFEWAMKTIKI